MSEVTKLIEAEKVYHYKAITVQNPLAGQLAMGRKNLIIRRKPISYRGKVYIVSAPGPNLFGFVNSAVIGHVEIVNCVKIETLTNKEIAEGSNLLVKNLANYKGYYAIVCKDAKRVIEMPAKPLAQSSPYDIFYPTELIEYPSNIKKMEAQGRSKKKQFNNYKAMGYCILAGMASIIGFVFWTIFKLIF